VQVGGYDYWVLRMSAQDAAARGISHHDLVRVHNHRGAVICAADVSPLIAPGVVKTYQASAKFDPVEDGERITDRGGCLNILTPRRPQIQGTEGMASNSCLVEVERWHG
jgi:trimethylamine-N-oxide reductase (cytochrome c)